MSFPFVKGHGTHNDFVVLPDLDGSVHGELDPRVVVAVCDRRGGIGADGVLRVVRAGWRDGRRGVEVGYVGEGGGVRANAVGADARPGPSDCNQDTEEAPWFMDYRNADGSVSQMCGNGVRVFARYLAEAGLVDPAKPLDIDTRDGRKRVIFCDDGEISVDMGVPLPRGQVTVSVQGQAFDAVSVDIGNPHAVVVIHSLDQVGDLADSPFFCGDEFPDGVNIEFVERRGDGRVGMRVFERGVGETSSCGTGACAVAAVIAREDGQATAGSYTIEVPGGVLTVRLDPEGHAHLKGPAVLVAEGTWTGSPPSPVERSLPSR